MNLTFLDPCIIVKFLQKKNQQDAAVYQNFIPYFNKAQHVSGDTPSIIRRLKLQNRSLVLHNTVEGCWTCSFGRCQVAYAT
jgi:hypothetical protein